MVMDQQPPIIRDFLGLGKLVTDDQEPQEGISGKPCFLTIQGLHAPSTNMDFTGVKHPVCNIGVSMEHNFLEGSAQSYALANARQWVHGTNTTTGGPPARVLASGAYARSNGTQLTIFYGGHVNVYNNVGVDKAQAIMHMAANGNLLSLSSPPAVQHALGVQGFCQPAGVAENFCFNAQTGPVQFAADQASQNCPPPNKQFECAMPTTPSSASSPQPVVPRALPLARKASLARFLEKRKERMQMMMPYFKKQLLLGQVPSTGDQMLGPFHGATLAKLYDEYYRRPSTMVFCMQEHTPSQNDMPSCGIPEKE